MHTTCAYAKGIDYANVYPTPVTDGLIYHVRRAVTYGNGNVGREARVRQRVVLNDAEVLSKTGVKPTDAPAGHMPRRTYKYDSFPKPSKPPAGKVVRLFPSSILATSKEERQRRKQTDR